MTNVDVILDYDALDKLRDLQCGDFGAATCMDYVDSITKEGDQYAVTIFVEPAGNVTKHGASVVEILDWWIEVFKTQPDYGQGMYNYAAAGWHLAGQSDNLPDNPADVWKESDGD